MRIAIIGGIGSGKSTVLSIVKSMGISTLSADEINGELLQDEDYIAKIASEFPSAVIDGKVDRHALASIIFNDDEARLKLNSIAHPLILERIKADVSDPLVVEMPLLLECGATELFDEVVYVHAPKLMRVIRIKRRRNGKTFVEKRMRAQGNLVKLKAVATRVLNNNRGKRHLERITKSTFKKILIK